MSTHIVKNDFEKSRIGFIDIIKGVTIFLVVWGHAIQNLRDYSDPFKNVVFELIYSFHMPLFFFLSGLFFKSSLKMTLLDFSKKRFLQLLLPSISWTIIFVFVNKYYEDKYYIQLNLLWFLKEIFVAGLITFIFLKFFKSDWSLLLAYVLILIIPVTHFQRFLIPFFWLGFFVKEYSSFFMKYSKSLLIVCAVFGLVLLLFWKGEYTTYKSPTYDLLKYLKQSGVDYNTYLIYAYRMILGICISLFFYLLFDKLYSNNKSKTLDYCFSGFKKIGIYTLAIYILQTLFLEKILNNLIDFSQINIYVFNFIVTPIISLIIISLCIFTFKLISRSKYLTLVLFGSSY